MLTSGINHCKKKSYQTQKNVLYKTQKVATSLNYQTTSEAEALSTRNQILLYPQLFLSG